MPLATGSQGQPRRDVAFPKARIADQDDRLGTHEIASLSQFENSRFAEALDAVPIELREVFEHREPGLRNTAIHSIGIALSQFRFTEREQILLARKARP